MVSSRRVAAILRWINAQYVRAEDREYLRQLDARRHALERGDLKP